jgi:hypothetical protein
VPLRSEQDDVARQLLDRRLSFDAHPTRTRGHGVQRRLWCARQVDPPRSAGAHVCHHGATHAQDVEHVVERATSLHHSNIAQTFTSINLVSRMDKKMRRTDILSNPFCSASNCDFTL